MTACTSSAIYVLRENATGAPTVQSGVPVTVTAHDSYFP